ncbi:nuclear hormone receptor family member nhr-8-like [Oppia nitens]|uniref:nuclear hormone receptor family member nhr-8-like n=1 Tax=Oppia nitens TaxID=1686743 RepID=UPI0023DAEBBB|nr:nuclear hormone receptor family member nhr-8-like [Oppia nitens]
MKSTINNKSSKVCLVCGDKADGYNFCALTCQSCKAFFRRHALKQGKHKCKTNNKCAINSVTRKYCKSCRLKKCFSVGMNKDWILNDEEKELRRHKIEENRQKRKQTQHLKDNNNDNNDNNNRDPIGDDLKISLSSPDSRSSSFSSTPKSTAHELLPYSKFSEESPTHEIGSADDEEEEDIDTYELKDYLLDIAVNDNDNNNNNDVKDIVVDVKDEDNNSKSSHSLLSSSTTSTTNWSDDNNNNTHNYYYNTNHNNNHNTDLIIADQYSNSSGIEIFNTSADVNNLHQLMAIDDVVDDDDDDDYVDTNIKLAYIEAETTSWTDTDSLTANTVTDIVCPDPSNQRNHRNEELLRSLQLKSLEYELSVEFSIPHTINNVHNFSEVEIKLLNEIYTLSKPMTRLAFDPKLRIFVVRSATEYLRSVPNRFELYVKRFTDLTKQLNCFQSLCLNDQIGLIKYGCIEVQVSKTAINFNYEKECWAFRTTDYTPSHSVILKLDAFKDMTVDIYHPLKHYLFQMVKDLRTDPMVLYLLMPIVLFNPDRPNLIEKDIISYHRNVYLYLLRKYLYIKYGSESEANRIYSRILNLLPEIRVLNELQKQMYKTMTTVDRSPLLKEILLDDIPTPTDGDINNNNNNTDNYNNNNNHMSIARCCQES